MKLTHSIIFLVLLFLTSCGCDDDNNQNFELTEFERSIIPFTADRNFNYVSQNDAFISANALAKVNRVIDLRSSDDESCNSTFTEQENTSIFVDLNEDQFFINVSKDNTFTNFSIEVQNTTFTIAGSAQDVREILPPTMSYSNSGFNFDNIYIFESSASTIAIEQIIYDPNRGIVFINYSGDNFLVLDR